MYRCRRPCGCPRRRDEKEVSCARLCTSSIGLGPARVVLELLPFGELPDGPKLSERANIHKEDIAKRAPTVRSAFRVIARCRYGLFWAHSLGQS